MNVPGWARWIFWVVVVLVLCALAKVNIGIDNGQFHFAQGLVH